MITNITKRKELVFRRPNPRLTLDLCHIPGAEHVRQAKLLGVLGLDVASVNISAEYKHKGNMRISFKIFLCACTQRLYLLKQRRDQVNS